MRNRKNILRDDIPNLLLLGILFAIASASIATADWTDGLWALFTIALLGVATSYLITSADFSDGFAFLMSSIYGIFVIGAKLIRLLPEHLTLSERIMALWQRIVEWIWMVAGAEDNEDTIIFVLLLGLLFWFLSYDAVRNLFRHQRLWRAVLPAGLALVANVYYYYDPSKMAVWVILYLFFALVLATRMTGIAREWLWHHRSAGFTSNARSNLILTGVVVTVALLFLAWAAPAASASSRAASAWERASDWDRIRDSWNRLFGTLRGGRIIVADYYGGARLRLGGPINLSDELVMRVAAREGFRYYWRSRLFDTYENGSWVGVSQDQIYDEYGALPYEEESYLLRQNVHQSFEIYIRSSRLTYAASQPLSVSVPVRVEVIYTDEGRGLGTPLAVYAEDLLTEGEIYNAISSVSNASENDLLNAGADYPAWVVDTYLQLPPEITDRTYDLAAEIAAPYDNPYDIANAIEDYMREEMIYNEQIESPPNDVDPVDYFLFESREGYCIYYASSMAIMLRTQGIPSRVAAGFAQGMIEQPDYYVAGQNTYAVAESDAHTWVEVYFPDYGWAEFEPTTNELPIERSTATLGEGTEEGGGTSEEAEIPSLSADSETEFESEDRGFDTADIGRRPIIQGLLRILRTVFWIAVVAGVFIGGIFGFIYWAEHRSLRNLSLISRTYARLNLYASWMRLYFVPGATPFERARELIVAVPGGEETIRCIVKLYVKEQYAQSTLTAEETGEVAAVANSWRDIRPLFLRQVFRRRLAKYWTSK